MHKLKRLSPDDPGFASSLRRLTRADIDALPANDVEALAHFARVVRHRAGTVLFRGGERADAMYILRSGEVQLGQQISGRETVVQLIHPGTTIGDLSVMLDVPHPYTAVTRRPTTLLRLEMTTIRILVEISPDICYRFLRLVSLRLERTERRVLELMEPSAFERVIRFLLRDAGERGSSTVELRQSEIASALSLSRQTVSGMLAELARIGLIAPGRGRIRILDRERLESLAEPHPR